MGRRGRGPTALPVPSSPPRPLTWRVEVQIDAHEGFVAVAEGAKVVALNTELTPDLMLEGLAREFVRRIQDLRKQADLRVDERIRIEYKASERLGEAVKHHRDYILGETLGVSLEAVEAPSGLATASHDFDGETLVVALQEA